MKTKHTKEYAKKLAEKSIKGTEVTKLMRMSFVHGYMEAVKESHTTELLEALVMSNKLLLSIQGESFKDWPEFKLIQSAINKATL